MASKKRLDYYGFNGYQVPPTPRAARSARRRGITQRRVDDNQMCAFDLLACIAGKLLVDGESSPTAKDNNIKNGDLNEDHRTMIGTSCNQKHTLFLSDLVSQPSVSNNCSSDIPHSQNSTFSNVELSFSRNHIPPCGSLPANRDDVKLGSCNRDDDENPMRSDPSLTFYNKAFRKLLAYKCWELNPKSEDKEHLNAGVGDCLKHQVSLRDYPYKKRKLYTCGSVGNSSSGLSTLSESERLPFSPGDSHVKLKIKSFRVPELFIEIPESATIGSLKRTVMEAVTEILGGGLCVGVLFQGKKVRDDKKTLLQTGISHNDKLDALGFTLEPNPSPDTQLLVCPEEHSQLYYDSPKPLKSAAGSRTLVPVSGANMESRATVPVWKPKRNKAERRRIRRPFSVAEVEALVQAVEKLGTGRWRDVKLRAFDEAKHRTYVDLKDKWKTLVHTARISPQQRRGEPVPQELLDRVLAAHAYWTQKQAKLMQIKHLPKTGLLL
ncbi:unnamed protein product [Cuscuta epithymum]|uniref:Uncharacterized protein n=1 Tax=Cuscuta epithymum TaxID=186058 RepID=A0AAV0FJ30_9ASTE|nr:unnamed protein product [Cuscuta epithymum]CAH9135297.1 unnamed protein product [Cuscuta epithymum]